MKIRDVSVNMHRRAFEVRAGRQRYDLPFAMVEHAPSVDDRVVELYVDPELGNEAFTYTLASGAESSVHIDQVLDYNREPGYLRQQLLYKLTVEAQQRIEQSSLSKRELIRRLRTSPAQLYRLLDQTNDRKSIGRMVELLAVLGCDVEVVVKQRAAAAGT